MTIRKKFIFVGRNGPENYVQGKEYLLDLNPCSDGIWIRPFKPFLKNSSTNPNTWTTIPKPRYYSSRSTFDSDWILSKPKIIISVIDPYGEEDWGL